MTNRLVIFLVYLSYFVESSVDSVTRDSFPDGFFFGAATSAYQIEGAILEGGKSLSNWDVFVHTIGKIASGESADIAIDHYHRYLEDVELMHSLGINAYRFSISWSRVLPRGRFGPVNPVGVRFYNNIIDNLLLKGIEPFVTINHFDIPQELEERYRGYLSPLIQEDFVYFAETCFKHFGDRVKYWLTVNEPKIYADMGYNWGVFPPGLHSRSHNNSSSRKESLVVVHNFLLSHTKAVGVYRRHYQPHQNGSIGLCLHSFMYEPLSDQDADREAAARALAFDPAWVLDPVVKGDYPPEMRKVLVDDLPKFTPSEMKSLKGSIDFIGLNHYSTLYAKDCVHSPCEGFELLHGLVYATGYRDGIPIGEPTGMPSFFVVPRGIEELIEYLKRRYDNTPVFVTENGISQADSEGDMSLLHDSKRIEFHKSYLAFLARAIRNGADVRGYFVWSLMDSFEWAKGFGIRYGLFYVDYGSLQRIPKLSAKWYSNFIANRNTIIDLPAESLDAEI